LACWTGLASGDEFFRDGDDVVELGIGGFRNREFVEAVTFGVVLGFALVQAEGEFFLPEAGEQLANKEHNEADVRQPDAGSFGGKFEAVDLSGDEVERAGSRR